MLAMNLQWLLLGLLLWEDLVTEQFPGEIQTDL
jgi:hypothetical protein